MSKTEKLKFEHLKFKLEQNFIAYLIELFAPHNPAFHLNILAPILFEIEPKNQIFAKIQRGRAMDFSGVKKFHQNITNDIPN